MGQVLVSPGIRQVRPGPEFAKKGIHQERDSSGKGVVRERDSSGKGFIRKGIGTGKGAGQVRDPVVKSSVSSLPLRRHFVPREM